MSDYKKMLDEKIERESDRRSKRQNTTANEHLDKAVSWYLKIGHEHGANLLAPMLLEAIEALKFECGNRCSDINPCNAKDVIRKFEEFCK